MLMESSLTGAYSLPLILIGAYGAGVLASFTPCIYPMIPITMGIISAQRSHSLLANFFLSLSYGLGIAAVYSALGYISVTTNLMFGQWLANPWFIAVNVLFYVYLAGSMFGWYEMITPRFSSASPIKSARGSYLYSFTFGILTGAAASPCLTPALALLLSFAAKQQNALVGISVLFAFAMGLSTLLIALGTFSNALSFLPRAGAWMDEVKNIFGFLLLAVCITYVQPLCAEATIMLLYATLALFAALHYTRQSIHRSRLRPFFIIMALTLLTASGFGFVEGYLNLTQRSLLNKNTDR